jgi:hypothetical protein
MAMFRAATLSPNDLIVASVGPMKTIPAPQHLDASPISQCLLSRI